MIDNPKLFLDQKNIFWKYYLGHCFILVCSEDENILMASNFLTILETFAKQELVYYYFIINNFQLDSTEKFLVILDALLPSGQLMFMTLNVAQDLIKNKI